MIRFFIHRMEKKYQPAEMRGKVGFFAGVFGLISNFILFIGKFMIGFSANSVSIMADSMNSLSDTVSSIIVLFGFKIAAKPADKDHPYGHQRFEYVTGLAVAVLISFVGFQFLKSSFFKILNPSSIHFSKVMFIVLVLSIGIKVYQGMMYRITGESIHSQTLFANAQDSFNDVYMTSAVLLSVFIEKVFQWRIDGYIGFILACYIFYSGIIMVRDFINELLGQRPTEKEITLIESQLNRYPMILGYHDLLIHSYGPQQRFASVHIEVDSRWSLMKAHEVIDLIEQDVKETLGVHLVCHLDPVPIDNPEYVKIHRLVKSTLKSLHPGLRMHDFRIIDHQVLQFDLVMPESHQLKEQTILAMIERALKKNEESYHLEITFDHHYLL
ncbi:cation diffusion facilitator family transporter [Enterococcus sp. LJL98]